MEKICIKIKSETRWIEGRKIIRFEASNNKARAVLEDNKEILSSETLKYYEGKLHGKAFYRINDKDMVNKIFVEIFNYKTRVVTLIGGTILIASFRKRRCFFDFMNK